MPYHSNIPLAGDAKSVSQGQILDNFLYLNNLVLGINNFIILPEQAPAPVVAINQMALYTKDVAGITGMFIKDSTGDEVDFTTAGKASNGWCQLPCGLLMVWGTIPMAPDEEDSDYIFATSVGFPGFGAAPYFVQATAVYNGAGHSSVYANGKTAAKATIYNSSGTDMNIYVFAIGIKI